MYLDQTNPWSFIFWMLKAKHQSTHRHTGTCSPQAPTDTVELELRLHVHVLLYMVR